MPLLAPRRRVNAPLAWSARDGLSYDGKMLVRSFDKEVVATSSRISPKWVKTASGLLVRVPRGIPHYGIVNDEVAFTPEFAAVNLVLRSHELGSWGLQSGATVTANQVVAPDETLAGDLITGGGVAESGIHITPTFTGNGEKAFSLFLKAGTSPRTDILIYDTTVPITRIRVVVTWTNGVPSLALNAGAGTIYPLVTFVNGWYRILFSAEGLVAANATRFYIYPHNLTPYTSTVYAWGAQAENTPFPTSYKETSGSTTSHSADSQTADYTPGPLVAQTLYARVIEVVHPVSTAHPIFGLFPASGSSLLHFFGPTSGNYTFSHNGNGATRSSAVASVAVPGQAVELRGVMLADGSVYLGVSVNGGAESIGATSASVALRPDAVTRARIGATQGVPGQPMAITDYAVQFGERTLAEMRAIVGRA